VGGGGGNRRTLTDSTPYYVNSIRTYAQKYTDVWYFLEYPLGNTWTYETAFGPLYNSIGRMLGLGGCPLLLGSW
jgi:hypothetical protein